MTTIAAVATLILPYVSDGPDEVLIRLPRHAWDDLHDILIKALDA